MVRRGQAALEFLTTYGWAFLVILVVIGALAYFGVLNPSKFVPERCTVQQEFTCRDYQVEKVPTGTGEAVEVSFYLTNNLGNNIQFQSANISSSTIGGGTATCYPDNNENAAEDLPNEAFGAVSPDGAKFIGTGMAQAIVCEFTDDFPAVGTKAKFEVTAKYKELTGLYDHAINAEIYATIQQ